VGILSAPEECATYVNKDPLVETADWPTIQLKPATVHRVLSRGRDPELRGQSIGNRKEYSQAPGYSNLEKHTPFVPVDFVKFPPAPFDIFIQLTFL
jgi:hypothetical protein